MTREGSVPCDVVFTNGQRYPELGNPDFKP